MSAIVQEVYDHQYVNGDETCFAEGGFLPELDDSSSSVLDLDSLLSSTLASAQNYGLQQLECNTAEQTLSDPSAELAIPAPSRIHRGFEFPESKSSTDDDKSEIEDAWGFYATNNTFVSHSMSPGASNDLLLRFSQTQSNARGAWMSSSSQQLLKSSDSALVLSPSISTGDLFGSYDVDLLLRNPSYENSYQLSRIFSSFNIATLPTPPPILVKGLGTEGSLSTGEPAPPMFSPSQKIIEADGTISLNLYAFYEKENRTKFIDFFRNRVFCLQTHAEQYADLLLHHHIYNLELLYLLLLKDDQFLIKLGFEFEDSLDIIDCLAISEEAVGSYLEGESGGMSTRRNQRLLIRQQEQQQQSSSLSSRTDSPRGSKSSSEELSSSALRTKQAKSLRAKELNATQYLKLFTQYYYTTEEIVNIYYQATQCWKVNARNELFHIAAQGEIFAEGYVMRMFALGQGGIQFSKEIASQIAERIVPRLLQGIECSTEPTIQLNSLFLLGVCYEEGLAIPLDGNKAFEYYLQSAEKGFSIAQAVIGYFYYTGAHSRDDEQQQGGGGGGESKKKKTSDYVSAIKWWTISAAQGHASAQTNLGLCSEYGHGVVQSIDEAIRWYQLAAKQGDLTAMFNLGFIYERKAYFTTKSDRMDYYLKKACHLYSKCYQKQYYPALLALGKFYEKGLIVPKDEQKAFELYSACVRVGTDTVGVLNNDRFVAMAEYKIGSCLERGIQAKNGDGTAAAAAAAAAESGGNVSKLSEAVYWYLQAAKHGNMQAQYRLAGYYHSFDETGTIRDLSKAIEYYYLSARQGFPAAQVIVGYYHEYGLHSFARSEALAFQCYLRAANQGDRFGEYHVARCYEDGIGVEKKISEMIKWYRKSADHNLEEAKVALLRLTRK